MFNWIKKFFCHKKKGDAADARPLRIEDVAPAPMTPVPDDAEMAAEALLFLLAGKKQKAKSTRGSSSSPEQSSRDANQQEQSGSADNASLSRDNKTGGSSTYYHTLANRIKLAHAQEDRIARRYVTFCEEQLANPQLRTDELAGMENRLYQHIDAAYRDGGKLLERWQQCLAEINVRQMDMNEETTE